MGNICVCIAALLLSLTGGMFLLAKTQKDNLGVFYKVMAWFVIVLSLVTLLCCGIRCVAMRGCGMMRGGEHRMMMMRGPEMNCMPGGVCDMRDMRGMEMRGHGGPGRCCDMEECHMRGGNMECCDMKGGGMECCDMKGGGMKGCDEDMKECGHGMKEMIKKDTVIIKK